MRTKLKLMLVLASLGTLGVLGTAGAASAGETSIFAAGDPMTTNVPYVAWAGEEVRLVKCIDDVEHAWEGTDAEWAIVDSSVRQRSGELRDPVFFDDTDRRTTEFVGGGEQEDRTCWAIDVDSVNPGMTRIKMAVDGNEGTPGSPVLKHDFLVIWLAMSNPVLTELSSAAFPGQDVGDPTGDGNFVPVAGSFANGLIRATVTGSFTDLNGNARTLPSDWASLAGLYASDNEPIRYDTDVPVSMRWDIHDDQSEESIHSALSFCAPPKAGTIDAVDNCLGSGILGEIGPFSRTIDGTFATVGPFDPARPGSSYLPNGRLDAGDAPMPAARLDFQLNGTVGALESADKHELYSRDRSGDGDPYNLYAPFNAALIPADISQAFPGYTTSGTTGPIANNFPGYQTQGVFGTDIRAYHYWDFLLTRSRNATPNACKDVGGSGQFGDGTLIPAPAGYDRATVYTDEHGEAILEFNPDVGASLVANNQGLCDLGEVNGPALLGSATITAQALDPYQPTFSSARAGNSLTKNVFELAGKSLDCVAKSAIEVFCVEVIRDIRGNPVVGAPVVFSADPMDRILGAQLSLGGYNTLGAACSAPNASDEVTCTTNALGQAGVVIVQTRDTLVNVVAENVATRNGGFGVIRDRCVDFSGGTALPTDGPTCASPTDSGTTIPVPTAPSTPSTPSNNSAGPAGNVASAATVVSLAGKPVPAGSAPAAKAPAAKKAALKLASARLVVANGKRFLVVRANGGAKTAKVRITLVMKTGKVAKPVVRTIRTNKAVRVANLQISKHVRTVRVALAR